MKKYISLAIIVLSAFSGVAQIPVGQFRSHISLNRFFSVAVDANTVYAATDNGLMLLDKSTLGNDQPELTSWTKVDGLSDIGIIRIHYDKNSNVLIICYENGNIDMIRDDQLMNVRDVKDKTITGSKRLQTCRIIDDHAFLVYPFGIVLFDLENMVISDTWFTKRGSEQLTPTDVSVSNQKYYVSTTRGVFSISVQSPLIPDFSQWTEENSWNVSLLAGFDDRIFAVRVSEEQGVMDTLCVSFGDEWMETDHTYQSVRDMFVQRDTLIICNWNTVELLSPDLTRIYLAYWYSSGQTPDARECVLDGDRIWVADCAFGLVYNNMTYYSHHFYAADGPYDDYVEHLDSRNGVVAAVHGTRKGSTAYAPGYRYPALSWFENQEWQFNAIDFRNWDPAHTTFDLTRVAINPKHEEEWAVASWGNGVFKCKDHRVVEHYNADNSPLNDMAGMTFVSGLQYDKKGNLWLTNSYCNTMLKMLATDGTWYSYNITSNIGASDLEEVVAENLLIDSRGYKWVNFPRGASDYHLIAFTDNGTYDNLGDDRLMRIDMNAAAEVSSSTVYCMAEDLDGEIWIGTDKGVKVIYYPSKVFDGNVYPRNILLEQDGYVSVLFEYEDVTAIAVDGANRKWIGTGKAGVFLMSENGQEQLLHFTAEDHPLFSNQIVDICVNQFTGEVFFATDKGLVSYKGTATGGFDTYEDLLVYPNPVPHDYTGAVSVNGLKANSLCKITDSSGKLVWQGYSDGGQLVWYCKDHYGNRPATGVYYIMASDEDGKEKIVSKFVFIH